MRTKTLAQRIAEVRAQRLEKEVMEGGENEVRRCFCPFFRNNSRHLESICMSDPRFLLQRWHFEVG